jgi:peroxiredoxin Q/BCP
MPQLSPGDAAPEFSLLDQTSSPVSLSDYRGRKVLIYFYPTKETSAPGL